MESFPNEQNLQNRTLSIMSSDHILSFLDVSLYKYKCIELFMNSLVNYKGIDLNEKAVNICSSLKYQH
jgi:hypothetical protein